MTHRLPILSPSRCFAATLLLVAVVLLSGCGTAGYYAQAINGHGRILARQQSCEKLCSEPDTPPELKAKLELARKLCDFAERDLKLPANGHYRRYADLGREYIVWNISAAPQFSLEAKTWWYPFVGRLEYRGYFAERDARRSAERLRRQGFDVCIEGAAAYSTLGWFKDPLLNTFVYEKEAVFAEILFHELAHQRVFARGDTDFNEAFATAVGQEGARRWLRARGDATAMEQYLAVSERHAGFVQLVQEARRKLALLYGDTRDPDGKIQAAKGPLWNPNAREEKQRILGELRRDYERLKAQWGGHTGYDGWFASDLNNAQLNSVATYYDLVPAFERLLTIHKGDLEKFYAAAERLAKLPGSERFPLPQDDGRQIAARPPGEH